MPNSQDLIRLRTELGETQAEFCKRFGISRSAYTRWEKDRYPTKGAAIKVIERVLADVERIIAFELKEQAWHGD